MQTKESNLYGPFLTKNWLELTHSVILPHVPDDLQINRAARHEPQLALFAAGPDGLDLYRELLMKAEFPPKARPSHIFASPCQPARADLKQISKRPRLAAKAEQDFIQCFI